MKQENAFRKPTPAFLPGYEGPLRDSQIWISTEELHHAALEPPNIGRLTVSTFKRAMQRMPGSIVVNLYEGEKTRDGYKWWLSLYFHIDREAGKTVAVFIPKIHDHRKEVESIVDRAVAVYTRGNVSVAESDAILRQFTAELKKELGITDTQKLLGR